jgi:protein SCO1/2
MKRFLHRLTLMTAVAVFCIVSGVMLAYATDAKMEHGDHGQHQMQAQPEEKMPMDAEGDDHGQHGQTDHGQMADKAADATETATDEAAHQHHDAPMELGVDEKIGQYLPLDVVLNDEAGQPHELGDVISKPTILALVYYNCPTVCPTIQANVAYTLKEIPQELGDDYQVISVSFDTDDTAQDAQNARQNYTAILDAPDSADWRFFTGDAANVKRLTDAVGFHFKKMGKHNFVHPNLITVVSGQGQVIRYLYGTEYLPFDIGMALTEAHKNTPGVSIKKIISYCFDYDPANKRYTFRLFRVFGVVTLATLGVVLFFLLKKRRRD